MAAGAGIPIAVRRALVEQALAEKPRSAPLLATLAEVAIEDGDFVAALSALRRRFAIGAGKAPARVFGADNAVAYRRLRRLIAAGPATPDLLVRYLFAAAADGDLAEVRRLIDCDRLLTETALTPPGDPTALVEEIRTGTVYRAAPGYRSVRNAWRQERILEKRGPVIQAIRSGLEREVDRYIADLPADPAHPLIAAAPAAYRLSSWAVISGREGRHVSHTHDSGWITGVYYVATPPMGGDRRGWLRVGWSDDLPGRVPDERWIRPEPGKLVLMPGYFPHDTTPTGLDTERIAIVFDVVPILPEDGQLASASVAGSRAKAGSSLTSA